MSTQQRSPAYRIEQPYPGTCLIIDTEDGERAARVSTFMPGPMVSITGPGLMSPDLAHAVAQAMVLVANHIATR